MRIPVGRGDVLRAEDGGTEGGCCVGLHARENVLVDGHGEGWAAVAESFADDFHGDASFQQDRGVWRRS